MQHGRPHIGKLAQLLIGNGANHARIFHHARIRHQKAADIRPVFIKIRFRGTRHDGARYIAPPAGKGFYGIIGHRAVKPRNHGIAMPRKNCGKRLVGALRIKGAVLTKANHACGVDKMIAEIFRKDLCAEIFAAARRKIAPDMAQKAVFDHRKFLFQRKVNVKFPNDLTITVANDGKQRFDFLSAHSAVIALIKHIRNLDIFRKSLSRCGSDNISARRVLLDDLCHLLKLCGIRKRAPAEFNHLDFHSDSPCS